MCRVYQLVASEASYDLFCVSVCVCVCLAAP